MGKRGKERKRLKRRAATVTAVVPDEPPRHDHRQAKRARGSTPGPRLYVVSPTYVLADTLACSFHGCIVCMYKILVETDGFGDGVVPNERPGQCLRASGWLARPACDDSRWCGLYHTSDRVLTVGDGDMSFSSALATSLFHASTSGCLVATSVETEEDLQRVYPSAPANLGALRRHASGSRSPGHAPVSVRFCVDATRLDKALRIEPRFTRCVFNFPCVRRPKGSDAQLSELPENVDLVTRFFSETGGVVSSTEGEVHVTHKTRAPFAFVRAVACARFAAGAFPHPLLLPVGCRRSGERTRPALSRRRRV